VVVSGIREAGEALVTLAAGLDEADGMRQHAEGLVGSVGGQVVDGAAVPGAMGRFAVPSDEVDVGAAQQLLGHAQVQAQRAWNQAQAQLSSIRLPQIELSVHVPGLAVVPVPVPGRTWAQLVRPVVHHPSLWGDVESAGDGVGHWIGDHGANLAKAGLARQGGPAVLQLPGGAGVDGV
jgi:hypothetical protein